MVELALIVMGAGIVSAIVFQARNSRQRLERHKVWRKLAERRRGHFEPPRPGIGGDSGSLDIEDGGVVVRVDVENDPLGGTWTRVRAGHLLPGGTVYEVHGETMLGALGKPLGFDGEPLGGDAAFDERFVVRAPDRASVSAAWTAAARALALGLPRGARVRSDGRLVTLGLVGSVAHIVVLERAIDLVAELAREGQDWLAVARKLPGARDVPPEGPWGERTVPTVELDADPRATARVAPIVWEGRRTFAVSAPTGRSAADAPNLGIRSRVLEDGRLDPQPERGVLDPTAAAALAAVGPAEIVRDARSTRCVLQEPTPERLLSAAVAVARLSEAVPSQGAFR